MRRVTWGGIVLHGFSILVLIFLMLPPLLVVPMSFGAADYLEFPPSGWSWRWYIAYFSDHDWTDPTLLSLRVAALTALLSTVLGTMASLALVRGRLAGGWINAVIATPMIIPTIITAVALYLLFSGWHIAGTTLGFVLAHTVLALPYVVFCVSVSLYRVDARLEMAALNLGASRFTSIWRVTLPLALPGILTGAVFAFLSSFDEATVSFFLSSADAKTLPKKMFEGIEWELSPVIAAVSAMLTLLTLIVVGAVELKRLRDAPARNQS